AQQEAQLALLARLKRAEEVSLPPEDPRATVAHFVGGLLTGEPSEVLARLLARPSRSQLEGMDTAQMGAYMRREVSGL
ncbi:hypothetical protein ACXYTC_24960, partial [Escherichia coli]